MAKLTENPKSGGTTGSYKKTLAAILADATALLSDQHIVNGYDTSRIAELNAFMAQPAIDWKEEQYSDLLNDLQANILKHHNKQYAEYLLLTFRDGTAPAVKQWLAGMAPQITTAKHQLQHGHKNNETILGLYLTYSGYRFLGFPESVIPAGLAFRSGLNQRARLAKDFQAELSGDPETHVIVFYAGNVDPKEGSQLLAKFGSQLEKLDATRMFVQTGMQQNPLPKAYHFKEGMSNPHFFPGASPASKRRATKPTDVSPLNIVLAKDTGGNNALSYGSFGAFLKLQINAKAIIELENEIAGKTAAFPFKFNRDMVRANIIGRFTDGTPLSLSDKRTGDATDDFDYSEIVRLKQTSGTQDDKKGARCPFHAHIRKANPRDSDKKDIRIVRRGVFYEDHSQEQGLLFLSFQRSLENQFEHILNNWMLNRYSHYTDTNGKPVSVNSGVDILFSRKNDTYEIPAGWNDLKEKRVGQAVTIKVPEQMVSFKGGLYFFAPSISFFTKLVPPPQSAERDVSAPLSETTKGSPFLPGTERLFQVSYSENTNPHFREGREVLLVFDQSIDH